MLYRYLLIVLACAAMLLGIQMPNFVDQYEKRLDAHFIEVQHNLRGFQEIADQFHAGSLQALIEKHQASTDVTFQAEAQPISEMYQRYQLFGSEKLALQTGLAGKFMHLAFHGNPELLEETYQNYTYNIPLNAEAIGAGAIFALMVIVLLEILAAVVRRLRTSNQISASPARPK